MSPVASRPMLETLAVARGLIDRRGFVGTIGAMADKIILRGAQFHGKHGVSPEERVVGGRIIVDIEIEYDLTRAGLSDDIADTISYSDVFKTVRHLVEDTESLLLEALARKISDAMFEKFPVDALTVYVRKQPPPIRGVVESAGVQVRRTRKPE
jgi:dihydroneopterin aldolase